MEKPINNVDASKYFHKKFKKPTKICEIEDETTNHPSKVIQNESIESSPFSNVHYLNENIVDYSKKFENLKINNKNSNYDINYQYNHDNRNSFEMCGDTDTSKSLDISKTYSNVSTLNNKEIVYNNYNLLTQNDEQQYYLSNYSQHQEFRAIPQSESSTLYHLNKNDNFSANKNYGFTKFKNLPEENFLSNSLPQNPPYYRYERLIVESPSQVYEKVNDLSINLSTTDFQRPNNQSSPENYHASKTEPLKTYQMPIDNYNLIRSSNDKNFSDYNSVDLNISPINLSKFSDKSSTQYETSYKENSHKNTQNIKSEPLDLNLAKTCASVTLNNTEENKNSNQLNSNSVIVSVEKKNSEGKYVCSYCNLQCTKPSVLQKHIRAHTNERPYPCISCGFSFKTKSNLYKHCRSRTHANRAKDNCNNVPEGESSDTNSKLPNIIPSNETNDGAFLENSNVPINLDINKDKANDDSDVPSLKTKPYKPKFHKLFLEMSMTSESTNETSVPLSLQNPRLQTNINLVNSNLETLSIDLTKSPDIKESKMIKLSPNKVDISKLSPNKIDLSKSSPNNLKLSPQGNDLLKQSPSKADLLKQHINDLINKNDAILDVNDANFLKKRFLQHQLELENNIRYINSHSDEPLNLSSKNNLNRKRCLSETHDQLTNSTPPKGSSLIKELLLKNLSTPQSYVCQFCKISFKNIENFETHRKKYCQVGETPTSKDMAFVRSHSVNVASLLTQKWSHGNDSPMKFIRTNLPLKSPGPFLGKTSLISDKPNQVFYENKNPTRVYSGSQTSTTTAQPKISPLSKPSDVTSSQVSKKVYDSKPIVIDDDSNNSTLNLVKNSEAIESNDSLKITSIDLSVLKTTIVIASPTHSISTSTVPQIKLYGGEVKISTPSDFSSNNFNRKLPTDKNSLNLAGGEIISQSFPKNFNNENRVIKSCIQQSGGRILIHQTPKDFNANSNNILQIQSDVQNLNSENKDTSPKEMIDLNHNAKMFAPNLKQPNLAIPGLPIPNNIYPASNNILNKNYNLENWPKTSSVIKTPTDFCRIEKIQEYRGQKATLENNEPLTINLENSKLVSKTTVATSTVEPVVNSSQLTVNNFSLHDPLNLIVDGKLVRHVPGIPGPESGNPIYIQGIPNQIMSSTYEQSLSPKERKSPFGKLSNLNDRKSPLIKKPTVIRTTLILPERISPIDKNSANNLTKSTTSFEISMNSIKLPEKSTIKPIEEINLATTSGNDNQLKALKKFRIFGQNNEKLNNSIKRKERTISEDEKIKEEKIIKNDEQSKPPKFLRPNSLALGPPLSLKFKTGHGLTPTNFNQSLISPDTPRPAKKYVQLYLNGNCFTYLGLKSSTKSTYCTLNKTQPNYVESFDSTISMYSQWRHTECKNEILGMNLYDSRQNRLKKNYICSNIKSELVCVDSGYKYEEQNKIIENNNNSSKPDSTVINNCEYESNEDYVYVRGRGRGKYKCKQCGIRCKKPSMLKKHMRSHTDIRPYTCNHCNFSFKTKGNLTKHMKSKGHHKRVSYYNSNDVQSNDSKFAAKEDKNKDCDSAIFNNKNVIKSKNDKINEKVLNKVNSEQISDNCDKLNDNLLQNSSSANFSPVQNENDESQPSEENKLNKINITNERRDRLASQRSEGDETDDGKTIINEDLSEATDFDTCEEEDEDDCEEVGNKNKLSDFENDSNSSQFNSKSSFTQRLDDHEAAACLLSLSTQKPNFDLNSYKEEEYRSNDSHKSILKENSDSSNIILKSKEINSTNLSNIGQQNKENIVLNVLIKKPLTYPYENKSEHENNELKINNIETILNKNEINFNFNNIILGAKSIELVNLDEKLQNVLALSDKITITNEDIALAKYQQKFLKFDQQKLLQLSQGNNFNRFISNSIDLNRNLFDQNRISNDARQLNNDLNMRANLIDSKNPPSESTETSNKRIIDDEIKSHLIIKKRKTNQEENNEVLMNKGLKNDVPNQQIVKVLDLSPNRTLSFNLPNKPLSPQHSNDIKQSIKRKLLLNKTNNLEQDYDTNALDPTKSENIFKSNVQNISDYKSNLRMVKKIIPKSLEIRPIIVEQKQSSELKNVQNEINNPNSQQYIPLVNNMTISPNIIEQNYQNINDFTSKPQNVQSFEIFRENSKNLEPNCNRISQDNSKNLTKETNDIAQSKFLNLNSDDNSAMHTLADVAIKRVTIEESTNRAQNVAKEYLKLATLNESNNKNIITTNISGVLVNNSNISPLKGVSTLPGGVVVKVEPQQTMIYKNSTANGELKKLTDLPIVKNEENRNCTICSKNFSRPSQLKLHMNIHYLERPFRCESCSVSFRTKGHLQKHERSNSHHNKLTASPASNGQTVEPRPFKCTDCNVAFRIHGHLAKHLRSKMHIMKLECLARVPFGLYAELERVSNLLSEINTADCETCLESLTVLAGKIFKDDSDNILSNDSSNGLVDSSSTGHSHMPTQIAAVAGPS